MKKISAVLTGLLTCAISLAGTCDRTAQEVDVLVVGGGVAGTAAALQAGRAGVRTLLVEQGFQVGGNMTAGGVNWPGLFFAWGRQVVDGCGWELVTNCVALAGGALPDFRRDPGAEHWRHQVRVNAPLWVALAEEALGKAKVGLRYHTSPSAVEATSDGWRVTLQAGGETAVVRTKVLIDATGNGAVSALAGARRLRDAKETQPGSFTFLFNPHAKAKDLDLKTLEGNLAAAIANGELLPTDIARGVRFLVDESNAMLSGFADGPDHGTTVVNYIVGADNSTTALRTETNCRGRASMLRAYRFLKRQPGLEKLTLVSCSPEVGVRETWRVEGDYVLTGDDYVEGRVFPDSVAYVFYPVDVHSAKTGVQPKHLKRGTVPTVPLRSLIAKGIRNLLVAGRCLSADRVANSGLRVQAACMATGQAAGEAAALAAERGCDVRDIPLSELKRRLVRSHHIVPKTDAGLILQKGTER